MLTSSSHLQFTNHLSQSSYLMQTKSRVYNHVFFSPEVVNTVHECHIYLTSQPPTISLNSKILHYSHNHVSHALMFIRTGSSISYVVVQVSPGFQSSLSFHNLYILFFHIQYISICFIWFVCHILYTLYLK